MISKDGFTIEGTGPKLTEQMVKSTLGPKGLNAMKGLEALRT